MDQPSINRNSWFPALAFATFAVLGFADLQNAKAAVQENDLLQRFANQLESRELDRSTSQQVKTVIQENESDPATAVTDALVVLYPRYESALIAADDDANAANSALAPFVESSDKFLAADASFYLARTLMNGEQYEASLPLLEKLTGELAQHSAHQGDAQYYIGVAQAGMLNNKQAIRSFMKFLDSNPNAAERLRVNAWRQVQELQGIEPGKLIDIRQRMDFSRRRLDLTETNEATQEQQDKIVAMLGKLIKEEEKKECSNSKGGT